MRSAAIERHAFTLVELMVVIVIIAILSALTLAGLAGARQRVKIDSTKNTIRKIHEVVMSQYESYSRRRVPATVVGVGFPPPGPLALAVNTFMTYVDKSTPMPTFYGPRAPDGSWPPGVSGTDTAVVVARSRLQMLRLTQVVEMPDSWGDVAAPPPGANVVTFVNSSSIPSYARTGPVLSYASVRRNLPATVGNANGSAECLYMIVACGGFEPDIMEQFRGNEIGDTDNDGAPEFIDAWGRPIQFIRWAPGISTGPRPSPIQRPDPIASHDPLDPMRVDPGGYALVPLIYSEGPDGEPNSVVGTGSVPWMAQSSLLSIITGNSNGSVGSAGATAMADNISNHDLMSK